MFNTLNAEVSVFMLTLNTYQIVLVKLKLSMTNFLFFYFKRVWHQILFLSNEILMDFDYLNDPIKQVVPKLFRPLTPSGDRWNLVIESKACNIEFRDNYSFFFVFTLVILLHLSITLPIRVCK